MSLSNEQDAKEACFDTTEATDEGKADPIAISFSLCFLASSNCWDIRSSTPMVNNALHLSYHLYCLRLASIDVVYLRVAWDGT